MINLTNEEAQQLLDELWNSFNEEATKQNLLIAIEALRARLAQPEPEPINYEEWNYDPMTGKPLWGEQPEPEPVAKNEEGRITWIVDDWPQNCFLYSEPPSWTPVEIGVDVTQEGTHVVGMYVLMPEAVRHVFYSKFHPAPPQREWQGLTDEEMFAALVQVDPLTKRLAPGFEHYARAIEAKLKEKNT